MTTTTSANVRTEPFVHSTAMGVLDADLADAALRWMERDAPWKLRIADFYEQWELHLDQSNVPESLEGLLNPGFVENLAWNMFAPIVGGGMELCEVTAHKLLQGQTIRLHNDFLEDAESHRILIQLNHGWRDEQGGLLMLFGSDSSADVRRIVRPLHRSAFAFSISDRSFHAVSTIAKGERYTLVYSFKTVPGQAA